MKILLLDGMSMLFRAYHAFKGSFTAPDGTPTNALYGFLRLATGIIDREKPDLLAVCIDRPEKTFRHESDETYKANRPAPPDDMMRQLEIFEEFLGAMGLPTLSCPGFEADDVIATVARRESKLGNSVFIMSSDRDILQLVDKNTTVILNKKGISETESVDVSRMASDYRLTPEQFVWFKAMKGDPSDNYGGVPGIGEKGAFEIASKAGSLEEIESHPKILANTDAFRHSLMLATLHDTVPLSYDHHCLKWVPDSTKAVPMLQRLGFLSFVNRFRAESPKVVKTQTVTAEYAVSKISGRFAIHVAPGELEISDDESTYKIDVGSGLFQSADETIEKLSPLLESANQKIVCGLKDILSKTSVAEPAEDVSMLAYLDETMRSGFDIETLKNAYLGESCGNSAAMIKVFDILKDKIAVSGMSDLYEKVEKPVSRILRKVEDRGIMIDRTVLSELGKKLGKEIEEKSELVYEETGARFNIGSPKQLSEVLFKKLQLEPQKKTKTGFSTSAAALDSLRGAYPVVDLVLDVRELLKLKNTYVDVLPTFVDHENRIHTTFLQMSTSTGRLASTNPNLQSIPVRSDLGSEIRKAFIAKPGFVIVSADYSQIELRVLAHLSEDPELVRAFNAGEDIHTVTARKIFDTSEVSPEQRRRAKVINFGLLYGMSAHRLSNEFKISFSEADAFIKNYFERFSGVANYIKNVIENARKIGYTTTILGRRRNFPELKSENFQVRSAGERAAINSPIQGSAADLIKLAMIAVEHGLDGTGAQQILQVHDELLVECPRDKAEKICTIVRNAMENVFDAKVLMTVDAKSGENWLEAK